MLIILHQEVSSSFSNALFLWFSHHPLFISYGFRVHIRLHHMLLVNSFDVTGWGYYWNSIVLCIQSHAELLDMEFLVKIQLVSKINPPLSRVHWKHSPMVQAVQSFHPDWKSQNLVEWNVQFLKTAITCLDRKNYYSLVDYDFFLVWNKTVTFGMEVIVVGNGHGDTSSNPGRDWLHFT